MAEEWSNWSGSVRFRPGSLEKPKSEEEVQQLVRRALAEKKDIKVFGGGHSSVPLVETDQILISQENLKGMVGRDMQACRVDFLPGTTIAEAGEDLIKLRLSMHNTGDVDFQSLAGAFGTGTHGSGKTLQNLSGMLVGCRLVDGRGDIREFTLEQDPEMMRALKVGLGSLGIFTQVTIQTEPARPFVRRQFCTHVETGLEHIEELKEKNLMFDFYWFPRSNEAKLRLCNPEGEGMEELPFAKKEKETSGWLYEILPQHRDNKYEEMEYALPLEAGPECFREVRQRVIEKHRHYVGWRVLYRTIAADNAFLSPFYQQDSVTIALLQNHELEYKKYFDDMEPIFNAYGGRPHWGKKHSLRAQELQPLFPEWDRFMEIRRQMDPEGIFLNDYTRKIFGL
jgi:FAD/FMN-containing dehydrogenase